MCNFIPDHFALGRSLDKAIVAPIVAKGAGTGDSHPGKGADEEDHHQRYPNHCSVAQNGSHRMVICKV